MKNTKKSLITSLVALAICFSMLVGTTFAWFTDSANVGIETIQTGELNLTVEDENGDSWEGKQLKWVSADANKTTNWWEPGATYETEKFYIKNEGNLNLKFKIALDDFQGDLELLNVMTFDILVDGGEFEFRTQSTAQTGSGNVTIDLAGTTIDLLEGYHKASMIPQLIPDINITEYPLKAGQVLGPLTVKAHMAESAGNEYMNKSLTGIGFTIIATQEIGEKDSNNEWYDKDSEYPVLPTRVYDMEKMNEVLTAGGSIVLQNDIEASATLSLSAGREFDGNGNTLTSSLSGNSAVLSPAGGTIKNVNIEGEGFWNDGIYYGIGSSRYASTTLEEDLVVENVSITNTKFSLDLDANGNTVYVKDSTMSNSVQILNAEEVIFENCHLTSDFVTPMSNNSTANIFLMGSMTFINCHFEENVNFYLDSTRFTGTLKFINCTYGNNGVEDRPFEPTVVFFTWWMEAQAINYSGTFGDGKPARISFTCIVDDTVVWEKQI